MEPLTPADRVRLALSVLEGLPDWPAISATYGQFTDHLEDLLADLEGDRSHRLT